MGYTPPPQLFTDGMVVAGWADRGTIDLLGRRITCRRPLSAIGGTDAFGMEAAGGRCLQCASRCLPREGASGSPCRAGAFSGSRPVRSLGSGRSYADLGRAATLVAGVVVSTGVAMDVIPGMCFGIMREGHRSVLFEVPGPFEALRQATGVVLGSWRVRYPLNTLLAAHNAVRWSVCRFPPVNKKKKKRLGC